MYLRGREVFIKPDCSIQYELLGSDYGNWPIVMELLNSESNVYSVGVGVDVSFDIDLIDKSGVIIHAFDPTPKAINYVKNNIFNKKFVMDDYGFDKVDGMVRFYEPKNDKFVSFSVINKGSDNAISVMMKRVKTVMKELKHEHIDVLKIDIEGAEYAVIDDMLGSGIQPSQLLIEFHHRFKSIKPSQTRQAVKTLRDSGYSLFYVSNSGTDYGFVREGLIK